MSEKAYYKNAPLASLTPGMTIESVYYLCEASEKTTKNGKPYCDLKLRDKTGCRTAKYWSSLEGFTSCSYVFIRGNTQEYAGSTNVIAQEVLNVSDSEVDMNDFIVVVENINEYKTTFNDYLSQLTNPTLKAIIGTIFNDSMKKQFMESPASEGAKYGAVGGALMQSCRIATLAEQMSYAYELSNDARELLIAASFISNVGKVYSYELKDHIPTMTIKGALYGDFVLSYMKIVLSMITLKQNKDMAMELSGVKDGPFVLDEDIILQLTHLVLSSRSGGIDSSNKEEKSGTVLPQSLEAMILSQCYLSDERSSAAFDAIKSTEFMNVDPNDPFTPWDFNTRRRFLKPEYFKKK